MKLYLETNLGQLFQGDCDMGLALLRDDGFQFDLCLTDPPYGIGEAAGKNKLRIDLQRPPCGKNTKGTAIYPTVFAAKKWDDKIPNKKIFENIRYISRDQIIFGGNFFAEFLKNSSCWIVWDKVNGATDFADAELIYTSFKSAVRIIKYRWNGMLQQNMKYKETRYHPTQKPIGLIEILLSKYSTTGQKIIDPFAGSGTTAIACENLNLRWLAIERDEQYCEIAAKRIELAANQKVFEDYLQQNL